MSESFNQFVKVCAPPDDQSLDMLVKHRQHPLVVTECYLSVDLLCVQLGDARVDTRIERSIFFYFDNG